MSDPGGESHVAGQREAHELLLIEEADAWFEYLEETRGQSVLRYKEVEPWAWARLTQRLLAIKTRRAKLRPAAEAAWRGQLGCRPAASATDAAACVDAEEDPDSDEVRDHRRAADREERQRDARDRGNAHRHADIDEDLEQQREHEAAGDDRGERVPRERDDPHSTPHDEQVEPEQDRGADEAALLRQGREDEVGVMLRQEVQRRLRRAGDPATAELTGADRVLRLDDVVRRAAVIAVRIEEPGQPLYLVRAEDVHTRRRRHPQDGRRDEHGERAEDREVRPPHAGDEQDRRERGDIDHRRPDVRLDEDEKGGDGGEPDRAERRPPVGEPLRPLREEAGEREDEEDLAELGRLEPER